MPRVDRAVLKVESVVHGRIEGHDQYSEIPLSRLAAVVIGRPSNTEGLSKLDIAVIGDDAVSRNHAEIKFDSRDNCFMIRDMGSTYGTFLNGEPLESFDLKDVEKKRYYELTDNCHIALAKINGKFRVELLFRVTNATMLPGDLAHRKTGLDADTFNFPERQAIINGSMVYLGKIETKVLEILKDFGGAVSIAEIAEELGRRTGKEVSDESVNQHICRIRKKLGETPDNQRHIITEQGRGGYRFVG